MLRRYAARHDILRRQLRRDTHTRRYFFYIYAAS